MPRDTRKSLIEDAKAAGLAVKDMGRGCTVIQRTDNSRSAGVILWEGGAITRTDVPAYLAIRMTLKDARQLLRLDP